MKGFEESLFLSSLSLGEKAAPNGLYWSNFVAGGLCFGFGGLSLKLFWDGGVDPEENLELRDEIHELRLFIGIALGALPLEVAFEVLDAFCSPALSFSVPDFTSNGVFSRWLSVEEDPVMDCSDPDVDPVPPADFPCDCC